MAHLKPSAVLKSTSHIVVIMCFPLSAAYAYYIGIGLRCHHHGQAEAEAAQSDRHNRSVCAQVRVHVASSGETAPNPIWVLIGQEPH